MSDGVAVGLFAALLLASVALGEVLRRVAGWSAESTRRLVHVGVGLTTAASPTWFEEPGGLYLLAGVFLIGNAVAASRGWFPGMHAIERPSWGTVVFPLALIIALVLCWTLDSGRVYVLQIAFAVLALADPAASLVGSRLRRPGRYRIHGAIKSLAGSLAFFTVGVIVTGVLIAWIGPARWPWDVVMGGALTVAALATVAEALGTGGWDNLWIVLAVVVPLSHLDLYPDEVYRHLGGVALALAFGALAYRVRALDASGALAGGLLAWMLVALGGVEWAVPALAFFVLSSAVSFVGRDRKRGADALAEKGSRRDAGQVVANGGVGMILLATTVVAPHPMLLVAFVGAFAAAAADTWATEIGTAANGVTRRLGIGPRVRPGTSGGMSLAGTAGALAGSASVVLAAAIVDPDLRGAALLAALVGAGVIASVVDSLLGASIQARYRRPDGLLTERASQGVGAEPLPLAVGWRRITNDVVNAIGSVTGGALAAAAWAWLG